MVRAEEIRSRTFLVSLRGFDREEVKAFLAEVAEALESAQQRVHELEAGAGAAEAGAPVREEAPAGPDPDTAPEAGPGAGGEQASPFAEVGAETQRILEAAQEASEQIRKRAQADAERELKGARAQAARIIAEGERQREETERVVEALTGARAELAGELRDVGRTIERVLRELGPARSAGTVREAMVEAAREEAAAEPEAGDARPGPAAPEREAEAEASDGDEAAAGEQPLAAEPAAEPTEPAEPAEPTAEPAAAEPAGAEPTGAEPAEPAAHEPGAAEPTATEPAPAGEPLAGGDRHERAAVASAVPVEHPGTGGLAAGRLPGEAALDSGPPPEPGGVAANGDRGEPPDGPGQRTRTLTPLHSRLVRKLKRGLQDLQNATLDALRRDPNRTDVEPFLPDETGVRALSALAEEQLVRAHAAGIASASEASGAEVTLEPSGRALADQLGSELGGVLVTRLADTLRTGFDAGQGMAALTERVDAVFTRIKSGPAGDVASVALVRAYEGGRKDAWRAAGVTHRRWVRATEPPCTDARCVDNESAGAVPVGERFPSRHDAPPVRPGCHCSTAPAGS